jgi:HSP20 family protein
MVPHIEMEASMSKTQLRKNPNVPLAYESSNIPVAGEVTALANRLRRVAAETFGMPWMTTTLGWAPAVEIFEGDKQITVTAELPGLNKDDIHIQFADGMLTLQGEKREERKEDDKDKQYHVVERSYGTFMRSFTLPREVDEKGITAVFRNGVLTVTLPIGDVAKPRGMAIPITE